MAKVKNGSALSVADLLDAHVTISGKWMWDSNREYRYRMVHDDSNLSVSITTTFDGGAGFQNCHQHLSGMIETYAIHEGWVLLIEFEGEGIRYTKYVAGQNFTIKSTNPHGLYVGRHTTFATTKYGSKKGRKDWEPCPQLDAFLKKLGIKKILTMLEK